MDDDTQPQLLTKPLREQLLSECLVMIRFALSTGRELPKPIFDVLDVLEHQPDAALALPTLAAIYGQLLQIIAPATPRGLRMAQDDERDHKILHTLGPVPSIRYLMITALVFTLLFFGISLFPDINRENLTKDIYDMSGLELLVVLTFLLSASGLGATFGVLFDAYQYVDDGRYDTKYDSLYWTRIGLGLVSGLMMAELLPQPHGGETIHRPLLALLGGFSASVVHRVLQRLVEVMESLFNPTRAAEHVTGERTTRAHIAESQGPLAAEGAGVRKQAHEIPPGLGDDVTGAHGVKEQVEAAADGAALAARAPPALLQGVERPSPVQEVAAGARRP